MVTSSGSCYCPPRRRTWWWRCCFCCCCYSQHKSTQKCCCRCTNSVSTGPPRSDARFRGGLGEKGVLGRALQYCCYDGRREQLSALLLKVRVLCHFAFSVCAFCVTRKSVAVAGVRNIDRRSRPSVRRCHFPPKCPQSFIPRYCDFSFES